MCIMKSSELCASLNDRLQLSKWVAAIVIDRYAASSFLSVLEMGSVVLDCFCLLRAIDQNLELLYSMELPGSFRSNQHSHGTLAVSSSRRSKDAGCV